MLPSLPRLLVVWTLLLSALSPAVAAPAPSAGGKGIEPAVQRALERTLRAFVKELLAGKNEEGESFRRGSFSRHFRDSGDGSYQVFVHVDTADKEKLLTERRLLTLAKAESAKDAWSITAQSVVDRYEGLRRSIPGDEEFRSFRSASIDLEGMSIRSGPGSLYTDSRDGRLFRIVLSGSDLSYTYEPPLEEHRALHRMLLDSRASSLLIKPERVTIGCSPDECERVMAESFPGLEQATAGDLEPSLRRAYDEYVKEIEDSRKQNRFSGFSLPYEPGDRYLFLSVKKQGSDQFLGLEYDNREPREVRFWVSGMGNVFIYHSAETIARQIDPSELERLPDYWARSYEVESLVGTVEMGFGDGEFFTGDLTFGLKARRRLKEVRFSIATLSPTGSADREIKNPRMTVNSITGGDGEEQTWVRTGNASGLVILPTEVNDGDAFTLSIQFESSDSIYKFTPSYSYVSRGGWLPFVRFGDMIDEFDLTVKVPSRYKVLGIGRKLVDRVEGKERITRWLGESPVEFPTVIFGQYKEAASSVKATRLDGSEIPVTMHVDTVAMGTWEIAPKALKAMADQAANALNLYREVFGVDYPYARLDLVNDPLSGLYGQAPSSLVYLGSASLWSKGLLGTLSGASATRFVHSLVAHEVAHQWWGSVVSNANSRNYWFVESLAEYASSLYVGAVDGTKGYLDHVAEWRREILESDLMVSVQDAPEMWTGERGGYRAALYAKGPYFFHILRSTWGEERFFAFLKNLAQELRGREIVTRDIQAVAEKSFQSPMETLFDQWIRGVGIPEYSFTYGVQPLKDGGYMIDGTIEQKVVVGYDRSLLEGRYFDAVVPVTVLGRKSGYKKTLIVSGPSTPFQFKVPEEPQKILLNRNGEVLALDVKDHPL
jgi:hypothetical protein